MMTIVLVIIAAVVLNICNFICARVLMSELEDKSNEYWISIGRPSSFAANHGASLINNLYKKEMYLACTGIGRYGLLKIVRFLLPASFLFSLFTVLMLAYYVDR